MKAVVASFEAKKNSGQLCHHSTNRKVLRFPVHGFIYKCGASQSNQQNTATIKMLIYQNCGFHPQKGQKDNFTREPPCLHTNHLSPLSREDQTRSLPYVYTCRINRNVNPCKNEHLFLSMVRIREPEHLRMR